MQKKAKPSGLKDCICVLSLFGSVTDIVVEDVDKQRIQKNTEFYLIVYSKCKNMGFFQNQFSRVLSPLCLF